MKSEQRKEIHELIAILTEQNLTEIEVERQDLRIRVRREFAAASRPAGSPVSVPAPRPGQATSEAAVESTARGSSPLFTVTSPMVGTFYRSPSSDADPYVEEGSVVSKGQVLCVVEAMKLMNEVESEADGRIVKVLVENGMGIEYGQPLFVIEPLTAA